MKLNTDNYLRGERWYAAHKQPRTMCNDCGQLGPTRDFITLYYRVPGYSSHRILARLCRECLKELTDRLEVTISEDL